MVLNAVKGGLKGAGHTKILASLASFASAYLRMLILDTCNVTKFLAFWVCLVIIR